MNSNSTVTVICIAFNHSKWIVDSLESVRNQNYEEMRLIVVDNASKDDTAQLITNWTEKHRSELSIQVLLLKEEVPYCKLFNDLLKEVDTDFVIDLSGDDYFLPRHVFKSVQKINSDIDAAFVFSDAKIIQVDQTEQNYYRGNAAGTLQSTVLKGDLYQQLIRRSCVCSPTVMFRTSKLIGIGGYDESLSYEDFDVQLRLARNYKTLFSDHLGVAKHLHPNSLSATQYRRYTSNILESTLKVCWKIKEMNSTDAENEALKERIEFELKHALWSANFYTANEFIALGKAIGLSSLKFLIYRIWSIARLDFSWLYAKLT